MTTQANIYQPTTQEYQVPGGMNTTWYPDSGASHHVTPDPAQFSQQMLYKGSKQVHIGNRQGLRITSVGSSTFTSPTHPHITLSLNNLLLVPSITKNLVSVSQFAKDNRVYFEFHADCCFVKSKDSNQVLLKGAVGQDGLYCFKELNISHTSPRNVSCLAATTSCNSNSDFVLWHRRLGHANARAVKTILDICNIPFQNKVALEFCDACCLGKAHRLYAPPSETVYAAPFELIFSDLWGPAPYTSSNGYTYYITFVDAHTKFTWLYFLKHKSEAFKAFTQFHTLITTQFQHKLKAIQTDSGGEYRVFTKHLNELGIQHRFTCPYTSHQNGSVERKHRQIVDMGLSLLAQCGLPYKYWDHSFSTAVHLLNRLPTSALKIAASPFHTLFHKQPDYSTIKVFGGVCFPLLRPYNHHKFQFKSEEFVYLGLSSQHKGHKCLSPSARIFISKDVAFTETKFPYQTRISGLDSQQQVCNPPTYSSIIPQPPNPIPLVTHQPQPITSSPATIITHQPEIEPLNITDPETLPNPEPETFPTTEPDTSIIPEPESIPNSSQNALQDPLPQPETTNTHHMVIRSKTGKLKPRVFLTAAEPATVKLALASPEWLAAMQAEYTALMNNNTWSLVDLPPNRKAIGCKWVFRVKENPDGSINKYKARLVAKGYHQQQGFDFNETFSPVVKPVTIRIILTLALTYGWFIQQIDINNAFFNGLLQEEIYMMQPPGFATSNKSLVCKLNRALYGLKQTPRAWYERLNGALIQFGFKSSRCDPSLFTYASGSNLVYALVYVDDIILTGSSPSIISDLINKLNAKFALKQVGELDYFLGIEVKHTAKGTLVLSQAKYI